jgi:hypothetical protein
MKPVNNKQIELEILEAFKGLSEAAESLDTERYYVFFDREKFTGLNADGHVWHSFDNLKTLISTGFPMIEKSISLEFDNVKVTVVNPITAILVNEYKHSLLLKSGAVVKQSGGGVQVWSKSNSVWKIVSVAASESEQP